MARKWAAMPAKSCGATPGRDFSTREDGRSPMRILLTRPREDTLALAEKLKARGHEILVEPMLEIRFAVDAAVDLASVRSLLFTSANGVRAFAAASKRRDLAALCVGDTTAAAARSLG